MSSGPVLPPPPPAGSDASAAVPPEPRPSTAGASTWRLRPHALWLVASLELRQRVRSKRWYIALGIWFVFLMGMSLLIFSSFTVFADGDASFFGDGGLLRTAGQLCASLSTLLLVFMLMLVLPALSAGSINGDRTAGTLATLQATLLSPAEIVVGKILAGWLVGLAFLGTAMPSVAPSMLLGGSSILYLLRIVLMIGVLSLLVTAFGVGMSSLLARQLGSVVLTYLGVIGTMVILPVIWGASLPMLTVPSTQTQYFQTPYEGDWIELGPGAGGGGPALTLEDGEQAPREGEWVCVSWGEDMSTTVHSEFTAPLLWMNPFVLVAETAPALPQDLLGEGDAPLDLLAYLKSGVRWASNPQADVFRVQCEPGIPGYPEGVSGAMPWPVWPMGLAAWTLVGGGASVLAITRLRVPMRRISAGTRIA
ncbi:ABC transporter permease [Brachybacterium hainanense]|uniref:ABC transporter permease n=1 Tax=Brachybacterium hainanense TaxID=1541174 RepID=A0ABV6RGS5_9MICO